MPKPVNSPFPTLLVNATERERVELAVVTAHSAVSLKRDERAQALPALIPELLTKAGLPLAEIKTIAVCNKPGSLTGTRIGVTVANTLGWLNRLPVMEITAASLDEAITELRSGQPQANTIAKVQDEVVY